MRAVEAWRLALRLSTGPTRWAQLEYLPLGQLATVCVVSRCNHEACRSDDATAKEPSVSAGEAVSLAAGVDPHHRAAHGAYSTARYVRLAAGLSGGGIFRPSTSTPPHSRWPPPREVGALGRRRERRLDQHGGGCIGVRHR